MDIPRQPKANRKRLIYGGIGLAVVVATTVALARLEPAAPTVEPGTIWIDTVQRGSMLREVRGPGTLVPEQIRWISAVTAGRVERRLLQPGQPVTPETVILELSNPDVQLEALEAQRQLTAAQAELVNLRTTLETQRLNQQATVATIRTEYQEAKRNAGVSEGLAKENLISSVELDRARDKVTEYEMRSDVEERRLKIFAEALDSQVAIQKTQVERLRAVYDFHRGRISSMRVVAGASGVLQELPLEVGQWAQPGAVLAKVVQPERLKAVLRIPETQAKDIVVGQEASIDTRNGLIAGRVVRIDPAAQNGTVTVDVALDGELPKGARPDLSIDGTIQIERLEDVLYVGRPAYGQANSTVGLFRLVDGGDHAMRVPVQLGRSSVNSVEIVQGLREGDVVILSDMVRWDAVDRVKLR